jgi:hypothetical protein
MKIGMGMILVLLSGEAQGMSFKRGKAIAQKSGTSVTAAPKPSAAPRNPVAPRNPATTDIKGPEDRGVQDMGCNDRDRNDPSKPCKNGVQVVVPPALTPIPVVVSTPVPPRPLPPSSAAPQGVAQACARFHPSLGLERSLDSKDGAEFEYRRVRDQALSLSDADLTALLMKEGIGACQLSGSRPHCPNCACDFYFKTRAGTWHGAGGWPLNPASRASTGCVSSIQWGGYLPSMATRDLMKNAAEQARHALCHPTDPCRLHPKNLGLPIHNSDVLGR